MIRPLMILAAWAFQGSGEDDKRIQEWIERLGSEEIEDREEAEKALTAIGEKSLPLLKKAAAESSDAELKVRAERVLKGIMWTIERQPIVIFLDADKKVKMEFVRIPAGKFMMGDKDFDDAPPHEVTLTKDYWMQTTETTQGQWEAVMGENPSSFKGADLPVERVSWEDCQEVLKKLNEKAKDQLKGKAAKLPSEAEWEYA
ncbi:MAG: formylglycine-generating enzyme family protein, partial [Planctomycetes bacterium]|nr:formylglycine-generating enzyme family protein [Planctomycetota bacterium]